MPELPEVEVVRRGLAEHVAGRSFGRVELLGERVARRHPGGPTDLAARLAGRGVEAVRRRGKYLWLELTGEPQPSGAAVGQDVLLLHLGMSGQLLVTAADAPSPRHLRASFDLVEPAAPTAGTPAHQGLDRASIAGPAQPNSPACPSWTRCQLRFVDQRTFGGMSFSTLVPDGANPVPASIVHIARDLLDPDLDEDQLIHRLRARRSGIKRALLDQTLVSGIGNIYADEALWRVGLHGERPCAALTKPGVRRLLEAARGVMTDSLAAGGTSFDALYVNINGQSGYFDRSLAAYGQEGRPCQRCGAPIRREQFMNRSSYSCPRCQPRPRPRR